jgi:hypothetical protein
MQREQPPVFLSTGVGNMERLKVKERFLSRVGEATEIRR